MTKFLPLIFVIGALFFTGCEENTTPENKFNVIISVVENGTTFSVKTYLDTAKADTKEKVTGYLNDTAKIIATAVSTGKIEPTAFQKYVIDNVTEKVPEPYNTAVLSALKLALEGYNSFYANNVKDKIENEPKARAVIEAIVAGIESGIDPVSGDVLDSVNPLEGYNDWKL